MAVDRVEGAEHEYMAGELNEWMDEARRAQEILDAMTDADRLAEFSEEVEHHLSARHPYAAQEVFGGGRGMRLLFDEDDDVAGEEWAEDVLVLEGIYCGVKVTQWREEGDLLVSPRIMHKILVGQMKGNSNCETLELHCAIYSLLDWEHSSVGPLEELKDAYHEYDPYDEREDTERIAKRIAVYTKDMVRVLGSATFMAYPHSGQRGLIDNYLSLVEERTRTRGIDMALKAKYGYVPIQLTDGVEFYPVALDGATVTGTSCGFDILEQSKVAEQPIRSSGDMIDSQAGLCIVVEPSSEVEEELRRQMDSQFDDDAYLLYVPTNSQKVSIALDTGIDD